MEKMLVSIIVPIYNVEPYLKRCLDSIIAQDYRPIEVVLINDGSPDACHEIIYKYESKWPFIRSFWQENQGIGAARNAGIDRAKGTYMAFVDADDYVEPDYISCLVHAVEQHHADVAVCNFYIDVAGWKPFSFPFITREIRMTGEFAARISLKPYAIPAFAWNKLYKASLFSESDVRFPSINYEDVATMSRVLVRATCVTSVRQPLYHYCIRKTGITGNFKLKNIDDYLQAVDIIRQFILGEGLANEWHRTYRLFVLMVETQLIIETMLKMRSTSLIERRRIVSYTHKKLRLLSHLQTA